MNLILASSSPNRKELLSRLRLPFSTMSPDIDEAPKDGESPVRTADRLAEEKGMKVLHQWLSMNNNAKNAAVFIASDQVAFRGNVIFDKPITRERAIAQLLDMQGGAVEFYTALTVIAHYPDKSLFTQKAGVMTSGVFRHLTATQIEAYVDADQPLQCAGSAKCESLGIALLSQLSSPDPTAIIGLPMIRVVDFLQMAGVKVL